MTLAQAKRRHANHKPVRLADPAQLCFRIMRSCGQLLGAGGHPLRRDWLDLPAQIADVGSHRILLYWPAQACELNECPSLWTEPDHVTD